MTHDEAAEVLGVDVYPGEADTDRTIPASFCEWKAEGSSRSEGDDAFSVWVSEGSDEHSIAVFEHNRGDDATAIPDLGDEAYFHVQGTASVPWIEVRVGDHVATIGVSDADDHPVTAKQARRIELAAAASVVPRL